MANAPPLNPQVRDDILRMFEPPYRLSMEAIAQRHRLTKNQVVGVISRAAHAGEVKLRRDQPAGPIAAIDGERNFTPQTLAGRRARPAKTAETAAPAPVPAPVPVREPAPPSFVMTVFRGRAVQECKWPTSNGSPWTFCCVPSLPGQPYCEAHRMKSLDLRKMAEINERRRQRRQERAA